MNAIKYVDHLSIEEASASFPVNKLTYLILEDGSPEVTACVGLHKELLLNGALHIYRMKHGEKLDGLDGNDTVPMIVSLVNRWPISSTVLPTDLTKFIASTEHMANIMLATLLLNRARSLDLVSIRISRNDEPSSH